jgi:hypothetical protein
MLNPVVHIETTGLYRVNISGTLMCLKGSAEKKSKWNNWRSNSSLNLTLVQHSYILSFCPTNPVLRIRIKTDYSTYGRLSAGFISKVSSQDIWLLDQELTS